MASDLKSPADTSVTALVSGIIHDAQELAKQQFELFKHEVRSDLRKTRDASMALAAGAALAAVGVVLLSFMLVYLIHLTGLDLWACFGIWGAVMTIAGGALCYVGVQKFETFTPLPNETVQTLKENVQWITNRR